MKSFCYIHGGYTAYLCGEIQKQHILQTTTGHVEVLIEQNYTHFIKKSIYIYKKVEFFVFFTNLQTHTLGL